MGPLAIVKADVKAHRWAFQHRKEIGAVMGTINNAIASKKTSVGAVGVALQAIGVACVGFGEDKIQLIGLVSAIIGAIAQAFSHLNARDNDVTSADAGAYGDLSKPSLSQQGQSSNSSRSGPNSGQSLGGYVNLRVLAVSAVILAVWATAGCVGLRRGLSDVGSRMLVPTTEQGVLTDLRLVEDDIAEQTLQKDRLDVAREAIASAAVEYEFDADKALAQIDVLSNEIDKNLDYLAERKKLLDAAKAVYDAQRGGSEEVTESGSEEATPEAAPSAVLIDPNGVDWEVYGADVLRDVGIRVVPRGVVGRAV